MDLDEYESLPTDNIRIHMTAGAIAGIMEHCLMYPVDSVKTRMQSLAPSPEASYKSVREGLVKIINTEGIFRTVRGISAVIIGAGPAHAMYFSAYEGIKAKLGSNNALKNNLANATAGCGATLLHDAIMVPSEVIKQRMQMYNSPYRSCLDCVCKLYCAEGMKVFYRSYSTQMLMNLPFHATHIMIYEGFSNFFNPERDYNAKVHLAAGACAGAVSAAITNPLDMCKTLLNTQEASTLSHMKKTRVVGIMNALRTIYVMQGIKGYFRGVHARVLFQMPGTAISWSVYELFKHYLSESSKRKHALHHHDEFIEDHMLKEKIQEKYSQYTTYDGGTGIGLFGPEKLYAMRTNSCTSVEDRQLLTK